MSFANRPTTVSEVEGYQQGRYYVAPVFYEMDRDSDASDDENVLDNEKIPPVGMSVHSTDPRPPTDAMSLQVLHDMQEVVNSWNERVGQDAESGVPDLETAFVKALSQCSTINSRVVVLDSPICDSQVANHGLKQVTVTSVTGVGKHRERIDGGNDKKSRGATFYVLPTMIETNGEGSSAGKPDVEEAIPMFRFERYWGNETEGIKTRTFKPTVYTNLKGDTRRSLPSEVGISIMDLYQLADKWNGRKARDDIRRKYKQRPKFRKDHFKSFVSEVKSATAQSSQLEFVDKEAEGHLIARGFSKVTDEELAAFDNR